MAEEPPLSGDRSRVLKYSIAAGETRRLSIYKQLLKFKEFAGGCYVGFDVGNEGIQGVEFAFGADVFQEGDFQGFAVDRAGEVEDMGFQDHFAVQGVYCRAAAYVEDGIEGFAADLYGGGEDAGGENLGGVGAYIGSREADLAAQAGALDNRAAYGVIPAQTMISFLDGARAQVGADQT